MPRNQRFVFSKIRELKTRLYQAEQNTDYMSALYVEEKNERHRLELEMKELQEKREKELSDCQKRIQFLENEIHTLGKLVKSKK